MEKREKLIAQIDNRLQLLITISVFFSTLLYTFFKFSGENDNASNSIMLQAGSIGVLYIINYLVFAFTKKSITERYLRWLDVILLATIGCFIFPLMVVTSKQTTLPFYEGWALTTSSCLTDILAGLFGLLAMWAVIPWKKLF